MKLEKLEYKGCAMAPVSGEGKLMTDAQSALDIIMSAGYELDAKRIIIDKPLVADEFFVLSSGLAGEILQKFISYGGKLAIYGDYSHYASKPLGDFIYESNRGKDVFFVFSKEEAAERLAGARYTVYRRAHE